MKTRDAGFLNMNTQCQKLDAHDNGDGSHAEYGNSQFGPRNDRNQTSNRGLWK